MHAAPAGFGEAALPRARELDAAREVLGLPEPGVPQPAGQFARSQSATPAPNASSAGLERNSIGHLGRSRDLRARGAGPSTALAPVAVAARPNQQADRCGPLLDTVCARRRRGRQSVGPTPEPPSRRIHGIFRAPAARPHDASPTCQATFLHVFPAPGGWSPACNRASARPEPRRRRERRLMYPTIDDPRSEARTGSSEVRIGRLLAATVVGCAIVAINLLQACGFPIGPLQSPQDVYDILDDHATSSLRERPLDRRRRSEAARRARLELRRGAECRVAGVHRAARRRLHRAADQLRRHRVPERLASQVQEEGPPRGRPRHDIFNIVQLERAGVERRRRDQRPQRRRRLPLVLQYTTVAWRAPREPATSPRSAGPGSTSRRSTRSARAS